MVKTINIYSLKAAKVGSVNTPKEFSEPINEALLSQAIYVYQDRRHAGLSKVKTRGEVSMTTAKMYRQKGTGKARHGAASAPIFVGGGKAHGPKGVKRVLELPKKMRQKALKVAWSAKYNDSKVVLASDLGSINSTKSAQQLVDKITEGQSGGGWKKMTLFLSNENAAAYRYFKNISKVKTERYSNANAYSVFTGGLVVVDSDALEKTVAKTKTSKTTKTKKTTK